MSLPVWVFPGESWRADILRVPRTGGVYRILNTKNGKCYVGSSMNIRARWRAHVAHLVDGKGSGHRHLTRAWKKYGPSVFRFEVLQSVSLLVFLLDVEQFWIDKLDSFHNGYNSRPKAANNSGFKAPPITNETRLRMSASRRRRGVGWVGGNLGYRHRIESKRQMSTTKRKREDYKIEFGGVSLCQSDWADKIGITLRGLGNRLRRGWPLERALTERSRGW